MMTVKFLTLFYKILGSKRVPEEWRRSVLVLFLLYSPTFTANTLHTKVDDIIFKIINMLDIWDFYEHVLRPS